MTDRFWVICAVVLASAWMLFACLAISGCSSTQQKAAAAEASYGAELQTCTQISKTRAESKACEAEVDKKWGVKPKDGGAQ